MDGRRPIGARARRIPEPELWLAVGPRQDKMAMKIVCWSLDDLQDYCQPHAPGQGTCGDGTHSQLRDGGRTLKALQATEAWPEGEPVWWRSPEVILPRCILAQEVGLGTSASAGRPEALLWPRDGAYNTAGLLSPSEPHVGRAIVEVA